MALNLAHLAGKVGEKRARPDELSGGAGSSSQQQQRRPQAIGSDFFQTLCRQLHGIHRTVHVKFDSASVSDVVLSQVEIEVRIGMILAGDSQRWQPKHHANKVLLVSDHDRGQGKKLTFKAGVDQIFARRLKEKLESSSSFRSDEQPTQILRSDENGNRWQVRGADDGTPISVNEKKLFFEKQDMALLGHDYDIRIAAATEEPNNLTPDRVASMPWSMQREKKRVSYFHKKYTAWQIDFTYVESHSFQHGNNNTKRREIEIEFEIVPEAKMAFLKEREELKINAGVSSIAAQLVALVDFCVPHETDVTASEALEKTTSPVIVEGICALNRIIDHRGQERAESRANGIKHLSSFDFLGSMPVNLNRQNLLNVTAQNYFMTEKSDGTRYLMYVVPDDAKNPVAVLVDRARAIFKFRGSYETGKSLGLGTVLDGELVYNR
jgi:hypothetical protein